MEKYLKIDEMLKEVVPQGLYNIEHSKELTKSLVDLYVLNKYKDILLVGCGSSLHGCACVKQFMEKVLKKHVRTISSENYLHFENTVYDDELVLVISFSGASTNSIEALKKVKETKGYAIGITGCLESDFKYIADLTIEYGLNGEDEPYETKGVTLLALYFMLFALEVALTKQEISLDEYGAYKEEMIKCLNVHDKVVEESKEFTFKHIKNLSSMNYVYLVSSGSGFTVMDEAKLKFGELLKIFSDAQELEEYIHGPEMRLNPTYTVFMLDSSEKNSNRTIEVHEAISQITDYAYLLTPNTEIAGDNIYHLPLKTDDYFLPLFVLAFFQSMVYELTLVRNSFTKGYMHKFYDEKIKTKSEKYNKAYVERLKINQPK